MGGPLPAPGSPLLSHLEPPDLTGRCWVEYAGREWGAVIWLRFDAEACETVKLRRS
jgi:hypothetical protein